MPQETNTLQSFEFCSTSKGNRLVVLGQIHGNEPCGALAIIRLMKELQSGQITLRSGSLKLIPVCNPRAVAENKRYIDRNLNRIFCKKEQAAAYEERIANRLIEMIGKPTLILDLHSFASTNEVATPFALYKNEPQILRRLTKRLGISYILSGWHRLQEANGRKAFDTIAHATKVGADSLGIECGQHLAPDTPILAYQAIRIVMDELNLCSYAKNKSAIKPKLLEFKRLFVYPTKGGGQFVKTWQNLTPVAIGEPIATLENGTVITAPLHGYVVLPNSNARPGDEWFYIAQAK